MISLVGCAAGRNVLRRGPDAYFVETDERVSRILGCGICASELSLRAITEHTTEPSKAALGRPKGLATGGPCELLWIHTMAQLGAIGYTEISKVNSWGRVSWI
jgi:hypothetical protein